MHKTKKALMGLAALAALALGGSAIAAATSGGGGTEKADGPDKALTGAPADKAGRAATDAVGGGRVVAVENSDEGGPAVYEVKVDKAGTTTEVQVSKVFTVTSKKADDGQGDAQDKGDGDGEKADDGQGDAQDKGDGDGEKADDGQGDAQDRGDGDGEKADDGQGDAQDRGDGDGEKADDGPGGHAQDKGDGDGENPGR
jgi:hypothetical protein